jgi:hypothetical protein
MSNPPPISFVLYITSESKGCEIAQNILKQYPPLKKEVHVQDIRLIEKPEWLRGVPVLAKIITREIWEGSAAIEQLHYLAGYYSALAALPSSQPWSMYNTNLTLPKNVEVPKPTEPQASVPPLQLPSAQQSVSVPPLQLQSAQQPVSVSSQPQPQPPLPPRNVSSIQPQLPPLPSPQQSTSPRQQSQQSQSKSDPNKVQPIPLPDDQRPQQELNLPPPPMIRKRDDSQQTATTQPLPLSPPPPPPPPPQSNNPQQNGLVSSTSTGAGVQTRRMVSSLRPSGNINVDSSQSSQPQSQPANVLQDHVAMVFSEDELDTIERVMFKPKTVNKRNQLTDHNSDITEPNNDDGISDSKVRVFPMTEKVHNTIVQKDGGEEDSRP